MCGIIGLITHSLTIEDLHTIAGNMARALMNRGPDDGGVWVDNDAGIGLGHRRLSIIDLSPEGHQPMGSESGRYIITFNGEIYNFNELRKEVEKRGHRFRGHSDTEVALAVIEEYGIEEAVKRFIGMFAIGLWDRDDRVLYLIRDRLGKKPLYYGLVGNAFIFASELKAFREYPGFNQPIDRGALSLFMRYNCIPAPFSIYKGIHKLLPGNIAAYNSGTRQLNVNSYWSARSIAEQGLQNPFNGTEEECIDSLEEILKEATKLRMISDVPLGAFLSGGIDSSIIVALMQAQSLRPVKTFSVGNLIDSLNEAQYAKAVAEHLGTDHTELYVTPQQALDVIPKIPDLYDEPFSDSSQIPTYLVSELARKYVTVSLSGDGGDELFGGYNRHLWAPKIWGRINRWPLVLRRGLSKSLGSVSPKFWDLFFEKMNSVFPGKFDYRIPAYKVQRLGDVLPAASAGELYKILVSHWQEPSSIILGSEEPFADGKNLEQNVADFNFAEYMMLMDLVTYLPDDILTKVDRASMGVSLEAREPFLDHMVVEFAWRIPFKLKFKEKQGKWILRQLLYRYVPKELVDRPKSGFGIPLDAWLREPLRDWAEALLNVTRLRQEGFLNPLPIQKKWKEHLSGKRNWGYHLWDVLVFQSWLESHKGGHG
jgi:asparagine synthase (glutamine-hydrolysing)